MPLGCQTSGHVLHSLFRGVAAAVTCFVCLKRLESQQFHLKKCGCQRLAFVVQEMMGRSLHIEVAEAKPNRGAPVYCPAVPCLLVHLCKACTSCFADSSPGCSSIQMDMLGHQRVLQGMMLTHLLLQAVASAAATEALAAASAGRPGTAALAAIGPARAALVCTNHFNSSGSRTTFLDIAIPVPLNSGAFPGIRIVVWQKTN